MGLLYWAGLAGWQLWGGGPGKRPAMGRDAVCARLLLPRMCLGLDTPPGQVPAERSSWLLISGRWP